MITMGQQPPKAVETSIARLLRCPLQVSAIASSVAAEHIRASLHGALTFGYTQAVHTTHLLSSARRAFSLTWPYLQHRPEDDERPSELCRDVLDRMKQLGDAWDSGNGRWLATPLRYVVAEGESNCLVLGSTPHSLVEHRLSATVSCAGSSRFVKSAHVNDQSLAQSVDTWLGPAPELAAWTTEILERSASRMQKVGGLSAEQLEIYAPDLQRRGTGRWIAAEDISRELSEVRLCRPTLRHAQAYNRPYYLAHFALGDGSLTIQAQTAVPYDVTLRLRMGLDMRLGKPRQLAIAISEDTFTIDKPLVLPDPESRVLALGWRDLSTDGPTDRLTFSSAALPFVLHALKRLSIQPVLTRRPMS